MVPLATKIPLEIDCDSGEEFGGKGNIKSKQLSQ